MLAQLLMPEEIELTKDIRRIGLKRNPKGPEGMGRPEPAFTKTKRSADPAPGGSPGTIPTLSARSATRPPVSMAMARLNKRPGSPRYREKSFSVLRLMNGRFVSPGRAFAKRDFPVPGGPTPFSPLPALFASAPVRFKISRTRRWDLTRPHWAPAG
jgi:hypothetical protein